MRYKPTTYDFFCKKCGGKITFSHNEPHLQDSVKEFHKKFDLDYNGPPRLPTKEEFEARLNHKLEEIEELINAYYKGDMEAVADALGDLLYLVIGDFNIMSIDAVKVFERIHETNMMKIKVNGPKRVGKPLGWQPPNLKDLCSEKKD